MDFVTGLLGGIILGCLGLVALALAFKDKV